MKSWIDAHERNDLDGLMSLLRDDLRFAMLPDPGTCDHDGQGRGGRLGLRWALPARLRRLALYHHDRQPHACRRGCTSAPPTTRSTGCSHIAVLHIVDGKIAELTGFDATDKPWLGPAPDTVITQVPIVDESSARAAVTAVSRGNEHPDQPETAARQHANTTAPPATPGGASSCYQKIIVRERTDAVALISTGSSTAHLNARKGRAKGSS